MERTLKVLIADDSEDDALLLIRELRKGGLRCEFQRVENSEDMKSSLDLESWDLIVTDHNFTVRCRRAEAARGNDGAISR